MKYIDALHSYIWHTLLLFNATSLDEVGVQATHLENRGKHVQEDTTKKPSNFSQKNFKKFKRKDIRPLQQREKEENHLALIARRVVTMKNIVGNCIWKRNRNSSVERGRQRSLLRYNKILVLIQEMKERSQQLEYKVDILFMLVQVPMMNLMLMNERGMSYFT